MRKNVLNNVPIEIPGLSHYDAAYHPQTDKVKHIISAAVRDVEGTQMLILHVYERDKLCQMVTDPMLRVFIWQDDYISQSLPSGKWQKARLQHILGQWWNFEVRCQLAGEESHEAIEAYLGESKDPIVRIHEYQLGILEVKRIAKHQRTFDRIDAAMAWIQDIPADFGQWIDEHGLYESRYIYYTYKAGKTQDGYCTHCKADVKVQGVKHNGKGCCPVCGSAVIFKTVSKSKHVRDRGNVALMENRNGSLIVRYFQVWKEYDVHFKAPKLGWFETMRQVDKPNGITDAYEWDVFRQNGPARRCDYAGKHDISGMVCVYPNTIAAAVHGTRWQYSALELFASHRPGLKFRLHTYIEMYKHYGFLEYMVKMGLVQVVKELVNGGYHHPATGIINRDGVTPQEVMKLSTVGIQRAREINPTLKQLSIMQEADRLKLNMSYEQLTYVSCYMEPEWLNEILQTTTLAKAIRYIESQVDEVHGPRNICVDWRDYLINAKDLSYDLKNEFALFPRDLKRAHDNAAYLVKKNQNEIYTQKILKQAPKLREAFCWEYGPYMIRVPETAMELIREGQTLHHCVGTYLNRIASGETSVVMLRKKAEPDVPFYTVEISKGKIIQCRGKHNAPMDAKVKKVMDRFAWKIGYMPVPITAAM